MPTWGVAHVGGPLPTLAIFFFSPREAPPYQNPVTGSFFSTFFLFLSLSQNNNDRSPLSPPSKRIVRTVVRRLTMAEKRSRSEMEDAGSNQRWEQSGPARKKHKKQNKKHNAKEGSANWIKKRIRTIERRFNRETDSMPSNVQKDLERELAAHQQRLAGFQTKKLRQKMITKYHMVRFFGEFFLLSLLEKMATACC